MENKQLLITEHEKHVTIEVIIDNKTIETKKIYMGDLGEIEKKTVMDGVIKAIEDMKNEEKRKQQRSIEKDSIEEQEQREKEH